MKRVGWSVVPTLALVLALIFGGSPQPNPDFEHMDAAGGYYLN
jgi:hypothetical protein